MPLLRRLAISTLLRLSRSMIIENLREIKDLEHMSPVELEAYQRNKLRRLLLHVHNSVPYYRERLADCGVVSGHNVRLDKFQQIPVLTRDLLRSEFPLLKSNDSSRRRSFSNSTGGSSGSPVSFIQNAEYRDWNIANKIYYKTFAGQRVGDRELRLWGSDRDLLQGRDDLRTRFTNALYNRKELNSFKLSTDSCVSFAKTWNSFKPQWVEAYAQSIFEFAKMVEKEGITLYRPRGVLTSAGTLYPSMKVTMERVFGCPVFNRYGSREMGDIACSCNARSGLHLSIWNHYLEILDDQGNEVAPGEMGRVHVTALNNFSMPLIRYDIGDIASFSDEDNCSCGRHTPRLSRVEGRSMSVFKTRGGALVPGEFFIHFIGVVFEEGAIRKFQVIQRDYDSIEIKIVAEDSELLNLKKGRIEDAIHKEMGDDCTILWTRVDDIFPLPSGKYLYTVSEIE